MLILYCNVLPIDSAPHPKSSQSLFSTQTRLPRPMNTNNPQPNSLISTLNAFNTGTAPHPFAPLLAYVKEQFGGPGEVARQFQEMMDEMVNIATMKDEYVCNSPFRFATMYGHLQGLPDALQACGETEGQ